jgi:hypothetical protein
VIVFYTTPVDATNDAVLSLIAAHPRGEKARAVTALRVVWLPDGRVPGEGVAPVQMSAVPGAGQQSLGKSTDVSVGGGRGASR